MKFLIVTGMSGGGKSKAVDCLEDMGFYCVDNMPLSLIGQFIELTEMGGVEVEKAAFVVDIRGSGFTEEDLDTYEQYRRYRISGRIPEDSGLRIDRNDAAAVYRRIRAEKIKIGDDSSLAGRFGGQPLGKIFVLMDVFNELGLVRMEEADGHRCVCAVPDARKRDLRESALFRELSKE